MQNIQDGNVPKPKLSDKVRTSPKPFQSYVNPPLGQDADYSDRDIERTKSDIDHDTGFPDYDIMEEQQWKESGRIHSSAQEFNDEGRPPSPNPNPPSGKADYDKPEGGAGDLKAQMEHANRYQPPYSSMSRKPRLTGLGKPRTSPGRIPRTRRSKQRDSNTKKKGDIWEQKGFVRIDKNGDGFPRFYHYSRLSWRETKAQRPIGWHGNPNAYKCARCGNEADTERKVMEWRSSDIADVEWHIYLHCRICDFTFEFGKEDEGKREIRDELKPGQERTRCERCRRLGNLVCKCALRLENGVCPSCLSSMGCPVTPYSLMNRKDYHVHYEDRLYFCSECGKQWLLTSGGVLEVITEDGNSRREKAYAEQEKARLKEEMERSEDRLGERRGRIEGEYNDRIQDIFHRQQDTKAKYVEVENDLYRQLGEATDSKDFEHVHEILDEIHDLQRERADAYNAEEEKIDKLVAERESKTMPLHLEEGDMAGRYSSRIRRLENRIERADEEALRFAGDPEAMDAVTNDRPTESVGTSHSDDEERIEDMTAEEFQDYAERKEDELKQESERILREMERNDEEEDDNDDNSGWWFW